MYFLMEAVVGSSPRLPTPGVQCTTVTTHNTIDNTLCQAANTQVQHDKIFVANGRKQSDKEAIAIGCTFSA